MSYSDAKYGLKRRVIFPTHEDIKGTGAGVDQICFATKTKLIKFGMIGVNNDIRVSSDTIIELLTAGTAATLAQNKYTTAAIIAATDKATGVTLTTATTLAANTTVQGAVSAIGSTGTFQYYIDIQEQFAVADAV